MRKFFEIKTPLITMIICLALGMLVMNLYYNNRFSKYEIAMQNDLKSYKEELLNAYNVEKTNYSLNDQVKDESLDNVNDLVNQESLSTLNSKSYPIYKTLVTNVTNNYISGETKNYVLCNNEEVSTCKHSYEITNVVKSTSSTKGEISYKCKLCGNEFVSQLPLIEDVIKTDTCTHIFDVIDTKVNEDTGKMYLKIKCNICGLVEEMENYSTEVATCNHDLKLIGSKDASTLNAGFIKYKCNNCGVIITEEVPIIKEVDTICNHDFKEIERKESTTTEKGYSKLQCSKCNYEITSEIPLKFEEDVCEHSFISEQVFEKEDLPRCAYIQHRYTCEKCGYTYTLIYYGSNHIFNVLLSDTRTSCTDSGYMTYKCEYCDETYTYSMPSKGHTYTNGDYYYCSVCGKRNESQISSYSNEASYSISFLNDVKGISLYYSFDLNIQNDGTKFGLNIPMEAWKSSAKILVKYQDETEKEYNYSYEKGLGSYLLKLDASKENKIVSLIVSDIEILNKDGNILSSGDMIKIYYKYYDNSTGGSSSSVNTTNTVIDTTKIIESTNTTSNNTSKEPIDTTPSVPTNSISDTSDCKEDTSVEHVHSYSSKVTKKATCGETGIRTYTCSCGDTYTEVIGTTENHSYIGATCSVCGKANPNYCEHNFNKELTTKGECPNPNIYTYTCSKCNLSFIVTEKTANSHNYELISDTATCEEDGIKTYKCSVCEKNYTEKSVAKGHQYGEYYNCTGTNFQKMCLICGKKVEVQLGSSFTPYNEEQFGVAVNSPIKEGSDYHIIFKIPTKVYNVSVSVEVIYLDGSKDNQEYTWDKNLNDNEYITLNAKCAGNTIINITNINEKDIYGNKYNDNENISMTFEIQSAVAHEHTFRASNVYNSKDCDEPGFIRYICSGCNYEYQEEIPAVGHVWVNTSISDDGKELTKTCSICGKVEKEIVDNSENIQNAEKHEHSYTEEIIYDSTCTSTGYAVYKCLCGDKYNYTIPEKSHNYINGICSMCGSSDSNYNSMNTLNTIENVINVEDKNNIDNSNLVENVIEE